MQAAVIERIGKVEIGSAPLAIRELPDPLPKTNELLVEVLVCGVCHTELDEVEGRLPLTLATTVPGHQVVGRVIGRGAEVHTFELGDRVGVGWIYSACGHCAACRSHRENLCSEFRGTGLDAWGGYAEKMVVPASFAFPIPAGISDLEVAPLLCAGAVGYRALRMTQLRDGDQLGLSGFGASGHLILKMVQQLYPRTHVFVLARSEQERRFALELGATWAGDFTESVPQKLAAVVDTTPAWCPIVRSLDALAPGGRLVINAIRKETQDQASLMQLDYSQHLWREKSIQSVANVTRQDIREFLELAAGRAIAPKVQGYALKEANQALIDLKTRSTLGAKVLLVAN